MRFLVGGIDGEGNVDIVIKGDLSELVHENSHLHVKKNLHEKVDEIQSLTVGEDLHIKIGKPSALESTREICSHMYVLPRPWVRPARPAQRHTFPGPVLSGCVRTPSGRMTRVDAPRVARGRAMALGLLP